MVLTVVFVSRAKRTRQAGTGAVMLGSVCIDGTLREAVPMQRCCWRGAFPEDLWFAQAHGKELASSSSRGASLGCGECLFRLLGTVCQ